MEQTARVIEVILAKPTQGNKGDTLYYHRIKLDNGDEGKMEQCGEENPQWLKKGIPLTYTIREGQYGNLIKKFVKRSNAPEHISNSMLHPDFRKKRDKSENSSKRSGWGSRLDDNPDYWILRQKCISMTTCLDRANDLIISKEIELKDRHTIALEDFNFIFKHAGLEALNSNSGSNNNETAEEPFIALTESLAKSEEKPIIHESKKTSIPSSVPSLFKEDSELEKDVLNDIYKMIDECDVLAKLTKLEKNLNPKWLEREEVINAISFKRTVLKDKNKGKK